MVLRQLLKRGGHEVAPVDSVPAAEQVNQRVLRQAEIDAACCTFYGEIDNFLGTHNPDVFLEPAKLVEYCNRGEGSVSVGVIGQKTSAPGQEKLVKAGHELVKLGYFKLEEDETLESRITCEVASVEADRHYTNAVAAIRRSAVLPKYPKKALLAAAYNLNAHRPSEAARNRAAMHVADFVVNSYIKEFDDNKPHEVKQRNKQCAVSLELAKVTGLPKGEKDLFIEKRSLEVRAVEIASGLDGSGIAAKPSPLDINRFRKEHRQLWEAYSANVAPENLEDFYATTFSTIATIVTKIGHANENAENEQLVLVDSFMAAGFRSTISEERQRTRDEEEAKAAEAPTGTDEPKGDAGEPALPTQPDKETRFGLKLPNLRGFPRPSRNAVVAASIAASVTIPVSSAAGATAPSRAESGGGPVGTSLNAAKKSGNYVLMVDLAMVTGSATALPPVHGKGNEAFLPADTPTQSELPPQTAVAAAEPAELSKKQQRAQQESANLAKLALLSTQELAESITATYVKLAEKQHLQPTETELSAYVEHLLTNDELYPEDRTTKETSYALAAALVIARMPEVLGVEDFKELYVDALIIPRRPKDVEKETWKAYVEGKSLLYSANLENILAQHAELRLTDEQREVIAGLLASAHIQNLSSEKQISEAIGSIQDIPNPVVKPEILTDEQLVRDTILSVYNQPSIPKDLKETLIPLYIKYGKEFNINPFILAAQEFHESTFRIDVVNPESGSIGLSQLMPEIVKFLQTFAGAPKDFDPTNPEHAVWAHAALYNYNRNMIENAGITNDLETLAMLAYTAHYAGGPAVVKARGVPQATDVRAYYEKGLEQMGLLRDAEKTLKDNMKPNENIDDSEESEKYQKVREDFFQGVLDELGTTENPIGCDAGNTSAVGSCGEVDKYTQGHLEYWCADFVSYTAKKAGMPLTGSYEDWRLAAVRSIKKSPFVIVLDKNRYKPLVGDFVTFGEGGNGHIAVVRSFNSETGVISYVGGNQKTENSSNGVAVTEKTINISDSYVKQFINITPLIKEKLYPTPKVESQKRFNKSQALVPVKSVVEDKLEAAGQKNGELTSDHLETVGSRWDDAQLHPEAADAFRKMDDAYYKDTGKHLAFAGPRSDYRTLADQDDIKAERGKWAADRGKSPHGLAKAADIKDAGSFDSEVYDWLHENAIKYGYIHPAWAANGGSLPEPWHWEYVGLERIKDPDTKVSSANSSTVEGVAATTQSAKPESTSASTESKSVANVPLHPVANNIPLTPGTTTTIVIGPTKGKENNHTKGRPSPGIATDDNAPHGEGEGAIDRAKEALGRLVGGLRN